MRNYSGSHVARPMFNGIQREQLSRNAGNHVDWNYMVKDRMRLYLEAELDAPKASTAVNCI
jgi:hypothetical protein